MKLTATQVGAKVGVTSYTVKRWYEFYNDLDAEEIKELQEVYNMPTLPQYELAGSRGDKLWDEADIPLIMAFKNWVPPTKTGVFKKYAHKEAK